VTVRRFEQMFALPNGGDSNARARVRNCGQGERVRCRIRSLYRVEQLFECVAGRWTVDSPRRRRHDTRHQGDDMASSQDPLGQGD